MNCVQLILLFFQVVINGLEPSRHHFISDQVNLKKKKKKAQQYNRINIVFFFKLFFSKFFGHWSCCAVITLSDRIFFFSLSVMVGFPYVLPPLHTLSHAHSSRGSSGRSAGDFFLLTSCLCFCSICVLRSPPHVPFSPSLKRQLCVFQILFSVQMLTCCCSARP